MAPNLRRGGLLAGGADCNDEAIQRACRWLVKARLADGDWPEEAVAGVFFNTAMLHYRVYKNYFPIWALGLYENTLRERQDADNASR
jgi:lanosterol synthase